MKIKTIQILTCTLCILLMYACQQEELLVPTEKINTEEKALAQSDNPIHSRTTVTINAQNNNGNNIAASIQAKVNMLKLNGGGTIHVDFGTKRLNWSQTVVLYDDITLSVNKNTEFYANIPLDYMLLVGTVSDAPSNVSIYGGEWIGNKVKHAIIYVHNNFQNFHIEGAELRRSADTAQPSKYGMAGVRFSNGNTINIKKCTFRNLYMDIQTIAMDSGINGLDIIDNDAYYHYDNNVSGGGFVNLGGNHTDINIRRNIVRGYHYTEKGGHLVTTNPTSKHTNINIIDNAFYCVNNSGQDKPWDNSFNGASGDVIALKNVDGFEVSHNAIFSSGEYGITAVQKSKNGTIHHNTIVASDGAAIVVGMKNYHTSNVDIYRNYIYKTAMDRAKIVGYRTNNHALNAWHNIRVWNTSNCKVRENVMEDIQSFGLYIQDNSNFYHNKNYYDPYTSLTPINKIVSVVNQNNVRSYTAGVQSNNLSDTQKRYITSECHSKYFLHTRNKILTNRTNNIFR